MLNGGHIERWNMRAEIPPLDKVDIRLLRVFKAVTECNGLAAAEETLGLGRSTISIHISDLETRFGMKLCVRGPGGFSLTPQGQVVYEATLRLFSEINSFRTTVAGSKGKLTGELTVWQMESITSDPLNAFVGTLRRFRERSNGVEITLNVVPSNDVERGVYDGRCDLGLTGSRSPLNGLEYEEVYFERISLYCGSKHPLFGRTEAMLTDDDLHQVDFVRRGYIAQQQEMVETNWNSTAVSMHIDATLQFILTGLHVGYLPEQYAAAWVDQGLLRKIDPERFSVYWPVYVVSREGITPSLLISTFREELLRALRCMANQELRAP
jgi:DNA-binding transcriptional LysR family regulator